MGFLMISAIATEPFNVNLVGNGPVDYAVLGGTSGVSGNVDVQ
jgi:hypothetical protein